MRYAGARQLNHLSDWYELMSGKMRLGHVFQSMEYELARLNFNVGDMFNYGYDIIDVPYALYMRQLVYVVNYGIVEYSVAVIEA